MGYNLKLPLIAELERVWLGLFNKKKTKVILSELSIRFTQRVSLSGESVRVEDGY